ERGGVGREDRLGLHDLVEAREVILLHGQLLDDRLDHQVGLGQVVQTGRPAQALEQRAVVGGRQLAALDVLLELLLDLGPVRVERLAYAATEAAAAEALAAYARERAGDETVGQMAAAFAGEVASRLGAEIEGQRDDFGVSGETLACTLGAPEVLAAVRAAQ